MIEGKIAGLSASMFLGYKKKGDSLKKQQYLDELKQLRAGPFGEQPRAGKYKILKLLERRHVRV